ncbi:RNA polymerase-associated protein RapA [Dyadobacter sp. CECT 9275]|uniref:RNA polymerase-associated protein RapA n=1 Tax=Dyadobacter helix TaxID=2822344 RepID=A0A916JI14_9BACT|nr:DEAD/DEAH box helicase [Dyadobacter sp. CECT 9275]CAG5017320.1 RNA polymerase-associated protein RapA [Dyadobacter sp. CECT 9275]
MHEFIIPDLSVSSLTNAAILRYCSDVPETGKRGFFDLQPQEIRLNEATFLVPQGTSDWYEVIVKQPENHLQLFCTCRAVAGKLCLHQTQVLYNMMDRKEIRLFFDTSLRHARMREFAQDYGLENEPNPDTYFEVQYANRSARIVPIMRELIAVNTETVRHFEHQLLPGKTPDRMNVATSQDEVPIAVLGRNKYYDHFFLELYSAARTKDGKIKNPVEITDVIDQLQRHQDPALIRFYSSFLRFRNQFREKLPKQDIDTLKTILANPQQLDFYAHDPSVSENINASSLSRIEILHSPLNLQLTVSLKNNFYEVSGYLEIAEKKYNLETLVTRFDYFVQTGKTLHLIGNPDFLRIIDFFRKQSQKIIIHESRFEAFRQNILSRLEDRISIIYSFLKPATKKQLRDNGFDEKVEKIIYLSEFGNYVLLTPVMKYGKAEVPVFTKKQIYSVDSHGNPFTVQRNPDEELRFISALIRLHPDFAGQEPEDAVFLHKHTFLDENWFLEAFEEWKNQDINVLGFNKITGNRLNAYKPKVTVQVTSGINWFDSTLDVRFGRQKVSLKNLQKAVKNRTKFVALGDGTQGILPGEWLQKMEKYFAAGELNGESIQIPKINFNSILDLYDEEIIADEVRNEIKVIRSGFEEFEKIDNVKVPKELKTKLRNYQKQGLNWLNFLDTYGFGGCLADDMGLGKTVQIIAFILSQRRRVKVNTNLIVVPTSLIFNWQTEVARFAPDLKIITIHGNSRVKNTDDFGSYEIVLTTYGTMLSDIHLLKNYVFNYIFLDESQAIKNPESLRYKAARLLQSRNKIVMTGTPFENNTLDLYGQLSFACPGLLGSLTQFRNHYLTPIDKFKDEEAAADLRKRINPFILRRTKKQVARELPDKTEMVLYCEMGDEQRKVYNAYEKEFYNYIHTKLEGDITRNRLHVLQGLTKLRQICNSPALLNDEEYYGDGSSKIEVLLEQIEGKAGQHKILVFSQFVTMLDLIRTELRAKNIGHEYLTGQTRDRESAVNNFQQNPEVRVFLISLKAGGTGLNLTEADYVYIVDPWWNPAVENQAIDRSHRMGQQKNVIAVRLICPDTIEEKIMLLQETKKELADDLIKTDQNILKTLTKSDLLGLVVN